MTTTLNDVPMYADICLQATGPHTFLQASETFR